MESESGGAHAEACRAKSKLAWRGSVRVRVRVPRTVPMGTRTRMRTRVPTRVPMRVGLTWAHVSSGSAEGEHLGRGRGLAPGFTPPRRAVSRTVEGSHLLGAEHAVAHAVHGVIEGCGRALLTHAPKEVAVEQRPERRRIAAREARVRKDGRPHRAVHQRIVDAHHVPSGAHRRRSDRDRAPARCFRALRIIATAAGSARVVDADRTGHGPRTCGYAPKEVTHAVGRREGCRRFGRARWTALP
eukprot:3000237-Prymnesium_polylepis.2